MHTFWNELRVWLEANDADDMFYNFPEGVSATAVNTTENIVGCVLPKDLVDLLSVHDGTAGQTLCWGFELLPLSQIAHVWRNLDESQRRNEFADKSPECGRGIAASWWNSKWIPIAGNLDGSYYCVDMAPADGGTAGQLLLYWRDRPERRVYADGVRQWLEAFVDALQTGRFRVEDEGVIER